MEKTEISFCARFPPFQIIHALTALCSFLNIELRALLSALSPLRFHAHFLSRKIFNTERVRGKKIIYKKYREKVYHDPFDGPTLKLNVKSNGWVSDENNYEDRN